MNASQIQMARARADVYYGLASALVEPSPGLIQELIDAAESGARILISAACREAATSLLGMQRTEESTLADQYRQVMSPPDRRPPMLYESLHRQGRLMGDAAHAVEQRYRLLGIEAVEELPDHASVELTFLGQLAEAEADLWTSELAHELIARLRHEGKQFLDQHAGTWIPQLARTLTEGGAPFYILVGAWLQGFLAEERSRRRVKVSSAIRRPILLDAATCTLCGLCTRVCDRGALGIREDASRTELLLSPEDCSGCNRCVTICPQKTLHLATVQDSTPAGEHDDMPREPRLVLRQSARLCCPTCHRPTVSQAEMDGIQARMGDWGGGTMAHLLQCPQCKAQA